MVESGAKLKEKTTEINESIMLEITETFGIIQSYCEIEQHKYFLNLRFWLSAKDCIVALVVDYLINIRISWEYFEKYQEEFEVGNSTHSMCCNTQAHLLNIINCKLAGIQRKIFIESCILFLVQGFQNNTTNGSITCSNCTHKGYQGEIEKMQIAKNYIIHNLSTPLTIPIIAGYVGTNQSYLKKGFKEAFNQTIFEFIQKNRMATAKYLLLNSDQSITEIASEVGYASLSSFSQAFKNYYGLSPQELTKSNIANN